ncbi:MAG TPA: hypothetical protein VKI65_13470, partial [Gemmataceae bacterium]|nr:hypothetical protein [Gemmataceae bacterium]
MEFNPDRVWRNVRQATTEDLLDRITVYRDGMEPEAVDIIEAELRSRGVRPEEIDAHATRCEGAVLRSPDGLPLQCSFCDRPAVVRKWGWHRVRGRGPVAALAAVLPLYRPRRFWYCAEHLQDAER